MGLRFKDVSERSGSMDMMNGPLLGKLCAFALPLAVCSVLQQLFNSADAAVVGRFVSNDALAAVGSVGPVISLAVNLFVGLSIGANVDLAIHIGHNRPDKIHDSVGTSILLSLASGVFLIAVGVLLARPALEAISVPSGAIDMATDYLRIYFLGMPFMMLYNFGSAILRSKGDTMRPLFALAVACVVNLGLNLLFVQFEWEVAGVAAATVISNGVCAAIIVWFLVHEHDAFKLEFRHLRLRREPLVSIAKIGIPAGLQGVMFSISNVIIQAAINGFGEQVMAGSAASLNYECYTYYLVAGFTSAAVTFTGQNYAARKYDRCKRVYALCMALGVITSGITVAIFVGFGEFFLGIFTPDKVAISYGMTRMFIVEMFEFGTSSYEVTAGVMRGLGWSMLPAVITMVGTCFLRIAWVYLVFPQTQSYESLMVVYPISWLATGTAMIAAYFWLRRTAYAGE